MIRLTYAGDQLCHGFDVASRTWPIFFGCRSTGPGLPGSFVDDCLTEPAQPPAGSPPATDAAPADFLPRRVLPKDLPSAIKRLQDWELDLLLATVLAEQERKPASAEASPTRGVKTVAVSLTHAKINAVRAAFKAGVTPSRIARHFGISQSDVRKALAE